jgi:hypothetical protein
VALAHDRTAIPTNTVTCNSNCKAPRCGDGLVNPLFVAQTVPPTVPANTLPEQCDPPGLGCSAICRLENCGNGVQDPGEQCDHGPLGDATCEPDCTLPRCGNHIKDVTEECDDGNPSNGDDCTNDCKFARCGDGFRRTIATPPPPLTPTIAEECDTAIGPTACTYNPISQPCDVCVACVITHPAAPFCGDGQTDDPFETCDSGNSSCGACSSDCQRVTSQAATGLIFAAAGADLNRDPAKDNDTFTLSDGFSPATTFELTATGTAKVATNIAIQFDPADSNAIVAGAIAAAINTRGPTLQITAARVGGVVTLTNKRASSLGNGSASVPRLTEQVTTTNFAVVDMRGGLGGDCAVGAACAIDADCASGTCSTTLHLCQ